MVRRDLIYKPDSGLLSTFVRRAGEIARVQGKRLVLNPYIISSHPRCTPDDMKALARRLRGLGLRVKQPQDFTPTPGTISTAMCVTGLDRYTKKNIHIPKTRGERRAQRKILEKIRCCQFLSNSQSSY